MLKIISDWINKSFLYQLILSNYVFKLMKIFSYSMIIIYSAPVNN